MGPNAHINWVARKKKAQFFQHSVFISESPLISFFFLHFFNMRTTTIFYSVFSLLTSVNPLKSSPLDDAPSVANKIFSLSSVFLTYVPEMKFV